MGEIMVEVPLVKYEAGVRAMAELESIRAVVGCNEKYYPSDIRAILGILPDKGGRGDGAE